MSHHAVGNPSPQQLDRFRAMLEELVGKNDFWTARLNECGIKPADVQSPDDFRRIPFVTKQQLVDDQDAHPPLGSNLTYPLTSYTRLHQTSGTTGKPMRWLDTPESWDWLMECWRIIYDAVGVTEEDVLAFPFSFGPFIGFWAAFDGSVRRGNLSLPMGGMASEARLRMIDELAATVVCCTPTYALRLAEVAAEIGVDLTRTAVRLLIVAGEPGGAIPATREKIESAWDARVCDHWGMTDIGSLGIEPLDGPGHLLIVEDECIAEIVDPKTGEPVATGELGELVITNLGRWGMPVIRYRTGDLVKATAEPCPSGSPWLRLEGGVLGRADDMVIIRGNNVFPSSIEAILRKFSGVVEYRITVSEQKSMPHLRIEVEPSPDLAASDAVGLLLSDISRTVKDRLNFQAEVVPASPGSLPRFELKGRRFQKET